MNKSIIKIIRIILYCWKSCISYII